MEIQRRLPVEINETVEMDEIEIDDGEDNWQMDKNFEGGDIR